MYKYIASDKIIIALVDGIILGLLVMTTSCAHDKTHNLQLTYQNLKGHFCHHHWGSCEEIVNESIIVDKHIIIIRRGFYIDDMIDQGGDKYYVYMIDKIQGLKAYITKKELDPDEKMIKKSREYKELQNFINDVKKNIVDDGGIDKIINSFEKNQENIPEGINF